MDVIRSCWKHWWMHNAFAGRATAPPTGSMLGRLPAAVAWTGSTKTTVEPSKTSMSTRWCAMLGNGYAAVQPGKQIQLNTASGIHSGEPGEGRLGRFGRGVALLFHVLGKEQAARC